MKHISILVLNDAHLGNIQGPQQLFTAVNGFMAAAGKPPVFKVQLVGLSKETRLHNASFSVHADVLLHEVKKTDLVIIPAVGGDVRNALEINRDVIPWIIGQHSSGAEIASLCIGAFFLASTGLMAGRKCTTHWMYANDFRSMFPDVNLVDEKIVTDEQGVYTSGGAYSFLNLLLYLIEKYAGRDMSILAAKVFAIEIDRNSQSPFIIFSGQKGHEDEPIKKAQEFIESNFQEKITVDQLASLIAVSRRNLERRFKKATSNTVVEYIQRVKIEAAKISLESSRENINEVMYKVGYTDTKAFRSTFRRITGLSPIEYRNKYNRAMQEEAV